MNFWWLSGESKTHADNFHVFYSSDLRCDRENRRLLWYNPVYRLGVEIQQHDLLPTSSANFQVFPSWSLPSMSGALSPTFGVCAAVPRQIEPGADGSKPESTLADLNKFCINALLSLWNASGGSFPDNSRSAGCQSRFGAAGVKSVGRQRETKSGRRMRSPRR